MEEQRRRHGTKTVDARWISQSAGDTLVQFIQKAHAQLNDCAAPDGLSESSCPPLSVFSALPKYMVVKITRSNSKVIL
jgi:hypothetical protein